MVLSALPQFRLAALADVPTIVQLVNRAYRGDSGREGWTTESDLLSGQRTDEAMLQDIIASPSQVLMLCHLRADLVGCVHLARHAEQSYLGMFTIDPRHQTGGIGKGFLAAAEAWMAKHWRTREIEMTVLVQRDELIHWYQRRGYLRTEERRPFPYGDPRYGEPLRADLEFVVLRKNLQAI